MVDSLDTLYHKYAIIHKLNEEYYISKFRAVYYCREFGDWYEELPSAKMFKTYRRRPAK